LIATHSKLKLYKNIEAVIDRGDVLRLKSGFRFYIEAFISQTCAGLLVLFFLFSIFSVLLIFYTQYHEKQSPKDSATSWGG
jgi:hypothetical protein